MKHIITEGEAYWGHATAQCFTCKSGGKILKEVAGSLDVDAIDKAQISFLIEVAREHEHAKPNHIVRLYEWRRATEYKQEGW